MTRFSVSKTLVKSIEWRETLPESAKNYDLPDSIRAKAGIWVLEHDFVLVAKDAAT